LILSHSFGPENSAKTFNDVSSDSALASDCYDFIITTNTIIQLSLIQVVIALAIPIAIVLTRQFKLGEYVDGVDKKISRYAKRRELVALVFYFLSTAMISLLESLTQDGYVNVQWGPDGLSWGFGQIYAVALLIAPILDLGNYLITRNEKLEGDRPISNMFSSWRKLPSPSYHADTKAFCPSSQTSIYGPSPGFSLSSLLALALSISIALRFL
jgi:hypothetical protein